MFAAIKRGWAKAKPAVWRDRETLRGLGKQSWDEAWAMLDTVNDPTAADALISKMRRDVRRWHGSVLVRHIPDILVAGFVLLLLWALLRSFGFLNY